MERADIVISKGVPDNLHRGDRNRFPVVPSNPSIGTGNGNGNKLGTYACMLAPTPGQPSCSSDGGKGSPWLIMSRTRSFWTVEPHYILPFPFNNYRAKDMD